MACIPVTLDALAAWHASLLKLESTRDHLVRAALELTRMPTTFPSNRLLRIVYLGAWILFKRGVPPRGAANALPCFDPDVFLAPGEDLRWEADGRTGHLQPEAMRTTLRAMTKMTPFIPPQDRVLWCGAHAVLLDLQSRGFTLRCSWLED